MYTPGLYLGMHLFWWAFWIVTMVSVFSFNVPERARINSLDPHTLLKRRLAKGAISEDEYNKISAHLRSDEVAAQQDVTLQANHSLVVGHPLADGLSFSSTWAILYSVCAILFWVAPAAMMSATSKLFHGMSFTQMADAGTSFGLIDFASVLTIGAKSAILLGQESRDRGGHGPMLNS